MPCMNILSIQSWVADGHVGNASAVFPLQRLGAEVWAINTVQFSNHTGYGHWTGDVFTGAQVRALVGNASAVFPLQRLGAEVWAINTVQFSNHTGYGHWTGDVFTGAQVRALVD